jgi:hypothetical protein
VKISAIIGLALLRLLGPETASLSRADQSNAAAQRSPRLSFSIYLLSRGTGVPEVGLKALQQVRELLETLAEEGRTVRMKETRIGLEGERRLCAEFDREEAADEAWRRAQEIVAGVDLVNLKAEPCSG